MIASSPQLHPTGHTDGEHLRARVDELEILLDVARGEAEQSARACSTLRDVLQLAAHEMRTPLGALRLQVDRLGRRARIARGSPGGGELSARCLRSLRHLNDMLETLTEYCRVQELRLAPRKETFDLAELVRTVVADVDSSTDGDGLHFATECEDPLPPLRGDPVLLRLVLLHLLLHAAAQPDPGPVLVTIAADGQSHRVTIETDASRGAVGQRQPLDISAAAPSEQPWQPGAKLAFILARDLVTAIGGRMEARSEPGGFGAVTLTIPSNPLLVGC
jgi:signal transduction histidine kinase